MGRRFAADAQGLVITRENRKGKIRNTYIVKNSKNACVKLFLEFFCFIGIPQDGKGENVKVFLPHL